ncbi:MAG TPA: hypothetical protein EYN66_18615, partial [Myxococcales bacterium]|nr:hypothetical protein [Myxococcales bacterium]
MRNGIHTIRGTLPWRLAVGALSPLDPTRLLLDNGNFRENFIVESFDIFPTGTEALSHDAFSQDATIGVLATTFKGAVAGNSTPSEIEGSGADDSRQIGWHISDNLRQRFSLDPDHLIVEDLFINAWTVNTGIGTLHPPNQKLSYIIKLRRVTTPI